MQVGQGRALPLFSNPVQELSKDLFLASETDHDGSHGLVKDWKEHAVEPIQPIRLQYLGGSCAYPCGPKVWHLATARDLPTCVMLTPSLHYELLNCAKDSSKLFKDFLPLLFHLHKCLQDGVQAWSGWEVATREGTMQQSVPQ